MKRQTGIILAIAMVFLCGCPGILSGMGGIVIAGLGLLANGPQLKLDTNLDQTSVVLTGVSGVCLGIILAAMPIVVWFLTVRRNPA